MTNSEFLDKFYTDLKNISYEDQANTRFFSKYIQASAFIKNELKNQNELNSAIVFPNSQHIINEFIIFEILRAIQSNEIKANYSLDNFEIGEKVSVGRATLIYLGKNDERVFLKCKDLDKVSIPRHIAPILQKTNSKQLSRVSMFDKERDNLTSSIGLLSAIASKKTHMDKTIVFINLDSSMADIVSDFSEIKLSSSSLRDLIYITKLVNGKPENVFSSRDTGISPLLCASDFVDLQSSEVNDHIHSIVIKYSQRLEDNIPFLQSLFELKVPITLIMDSKDYLSSNIISLFKVWMWDKSNILSFSTPEDANTYPYINNCSKQHISYEIVHDKLIDECFSCITKVFRTFKKQMESFDGYMFIIDLYTMVLDLVRFPFIDNRHGVNIFERFIKLREIRTEVEQQKNYIDPESYDDINIVIQNLSAIYEGKDYSYPKGEKLKEIVVKYSNKQRDICIIIPENTSNKQELFDYIRPFNNRIMIYRPSEFLKIDASDSVCIVLGWLKRKQMLELLYSFNSQEMVVILYSAENKKWKEQTSKTWNEKLKANNRLHIQSTEDKISFSFGTAQQSDTEEYDEEESLRQTVLFSKHRKYRNQGSNSNRNPVVEASSIELSDNQFMFVTEKHKMLIVDSSLTIVHSFTIKEIKEGDYLVIRKSSRDVIKEEADRILHNNGYDKERDIASEWKPLLEKLFWEYNRNYPLLYKALQEKGCSVIIQTFRMWVNEPDIIMMDSINDLKSIIDLSAEKPKHNANEIFDCGRIVKAAHMEAGKIISDKLRSYLTHNKPSSMLSDSIDVTIPDIGEISLMEISSISREKETVEIKHIHRLLS